MEIKRASGCFTMLALMLSKPGSNPLLLINKQRALNYLCEIELKSITN
jgi:hypothetical protein